MDDLQHALAWLETREEQVADLKHQLEEKEREAFEWRMRAQDEGERADEKRAHADALAGAVEDTNKMLASAKAEAECLGREIDRLESNGCHVTCLLDDDAMEMYEEQVNRSHSILKAYRNREE